MDWQRDYDHIPHDLVHYVVEAELGLTNGVYGRAAQGGGTFISTAARDESARERARQQRKQRRREQSLRSADERGENQMLASERLAALSDVMFRRRRGQRPDLTRKAPESPTREESARVDRVVARLEILAQAWSVLPVGGSLAFVWPSTAPRS